MKQSTAYGPWILFLAVAVAGSIVSALVPEISARGLECLVGGFSVFST